MARLVVLLSVLFIPTYCLGAEQKTPPRPGLILAVVDGAERWLEADDLTGFPGYLVKYKAYAGESLECETEITTIKGFVGHLVNSRTRGEMLPDGTFGKYSIVDNFMLVENPSQQHGSPVSAVSEDPKIVFAPVLRQTSKFSLGGLDLYVYSQRANRIELEVYSNDFPGYDLDYSQPGLPIATLRHPKTQELVGVLTGALKPENKEVRVQLPEPRYGPPPIGPDGKPILPSAGGVPMVDEEK